MTVLVATARNHLMLFDKGKADRTVEVVLILSTPVYHLDADADEGLRKEVELPATRFLASPDDLRGLAATLCQYADESDKMVEAGEEKETLAPSPLDVLLQKVTLEGQSMTVVPVKDDDTLKYGFEATLDHHIDGIGRGATASEAIGDLARQLLDTNPRGDAEEGKTRDES